MKKTNILVFIMDFVIETPFKVVLSVFDSFISFLKEKREETEEEPQDKTSKPKPKTD